MPSRIIGTGRYLPVHVVTNDELAKRVDTSDEWIRTRTGIHQRHVAAAGEQTSDLAHMASKEALAAIADLMIDRGMAQRALVVGAEIYSRILDWNDRGTCVLFGDGAGAVVLARSEECGILSAHLHADGHYRDILCVPGQVREGMVSGRPFVHMDGPEVFKFAVRVMTEVAQEALAHNHLSVDAIDWLVPHQANLRIMDATARKLGLPKERVISTVAQHANTSAASIPLALDIAARDGRIRAGQHLMLIGVGGGFTWGSVFLRW